MSGNNSKNKVVFKSTKWQTVATTKTADSSEAVTMTEGSSREQGADQDKYTKIGIAVGVIATVVVLSTITFAHINFAKEDGEKLFLFSQLYREMVRVF